MPENFPVPRPIELEPERSREVGILDGDDQVRAQETLTGRVEFGGPVVAPVDGTYHPEDAELQAYLKSQARSLRFVLALMSVNFPFGAPPLVAASVEVSLWDDSGTDHALAYSVFPSSVAQAKEVSHGFALQPNLTIAGTGGTLGGPTRNTVDHGTEAYLIGGPELTSRPAWRFRRTKAQDIVGPTRLIMVVQVPAGRTGSLSVSLAASIDKRFGFSKRPVPLNGAAGGNPAVITF
jgi:hypothetical protein